MGYYINADDIAAQLTAGGFSLNDFDVVFNEYNFYFFAVSSGLLNNNFSISNLRNSFSCKDNTIKLTRGGLKEKLAQIIARFLREEMLRNGRRFSFETVFSHPSNVQIMRQAADMGYKVYLYFVATDSPEINKSRVLVRKQKGGHDVPPAYIEKRYYRSLELLYDACEACYQAFFFDNSINGKEFKLISHFKVKSGKKIWKTPYKGDLPTWFVKYYLNKIP